MEGNTIQSALKTKLFKEYKFILPLCYLIIAMITSVLLYLLQYPIYLDYLYLFINFPTKWLSDYILSSGARDYFAINFIFYTLILYLIKMVFINSHSRISKINILSFAVIYSVIVGFFDHSGFHNLFPPFAFMNMLAEVLTIPGFYFQISILGDSQANLFANFLVVEVNAIFTNLLIWFLFGYIIDKVLKRNRSRISLNSPQTPDMVG